MTRNARIWEETRFGIRYWGPIDDRSEFAVVYRFPFDFPVRSASLFASLNLGEPRREWVLSRSRPIQHSAGPRWSEDNNIYPHGGPAILRR